MVANLLEHCKVHGQHGELKGVLQGISVYNLSICVFLFGITPRSTPVKRLFSKLGLRNPNLGMGWRKRLSAERVLS